MSVNSIVSFSNHFATRTPIRPKVTGRHSEPRFFAPPKKPASGEYEIPEPSDDVKKRLERMRKQKDAGQKPSVNDAPEPVGTTL